MWYDIKAKKKGVRQDRVGFKKELKLFAKPNPRVPGRVDLQVDLWTGVRYNTFYHRLIGLSLLQCHWNSRGQLLRLCGQDDLYFGQ